MSSTANWLSLSISASQPTYHGVSVILASLVNLTLSYSEHGTPSQLPKVSNRLQIQRAGKLEVNTSFYNKDDTLRLWNPSFQLDSDERIVDAEYHPGKEGWT
jgi:hypothetical protein